MNKPKIPTFLSIFFIASLIISFPLKGEIKTGEIPVNGEIYTYTRTTTEASILNQKGQIVFQSRCHGDSEVLLNLGYSETLSSFFVFKEKIDLEAPTYSLFLQTKDAIFTIGSQSTKPFYTPILVEWQIPLIIYITERQSIVAVDFHSGKQLREKNFGLPILKLKNETINGQPGITFLQCTGKIYRPVKMTVDKFLASQKGYPGPLYQSPKQDRFPPPRLDETAAVLSFRKFLCFGDSITYGYINKKPAKELGYVPRLHKLINDFLYSGTAINEGKSGTQTSEAIERFEATIKKYKAKYLLFHYGTNDAIHIEVPLSVVQHNIDTMINEARNYGMHPILTTLIPRNGETGTGIRLLRAIDISRHIRSIAQSREIPLIDLWHIFAQYPSGQGGYRSLMSDNVHPSEKGYRVMAEEWLKKIPPWKATNIHEVEKTRNYIVMAWNENIARDFDHWVIEFGFFNQELTHSLTTVDNSYRFNINPYANARLYFKIKAIDCDENSSEFSEIFEINVGD